MKNLLLLTALLVTSIANAEVKPHGTILTSQCGKNKAQQGEVPTGFFLNEVCVARAVGIQGAELIRFRYMNNSLKDFVVVGVKQLPSPHHAQYNTYQYSLLNGFSNVSRYKILKTFKILVYKDLDGTIVGIKGTGPHGLKLKVDKLENMYHTM